MAQYFQVVDQTARAPTDELQATYSNQGVHYIIQTSEPNQTFVLDNVIEQPVIQQFPQQQQQLFIVSSPAKQAPSMQPVVLNHTLQTPVMMNNAPLLRPLARGSPTQRPRNAAGMLRGAASPASVRPALRTGMRPTQSNSPRAIASAITTPAPVAPINGMDMVKMEDGRILPWSEYQKILEQKKLQQQQQIKTLNSAPRQAIRARPGLPRSACRSPFGYRAGLPALQPQQPQQQVQQEAPTIDVPKRSKSAKIIQPNATGKLPRILREFEPSQEIKDIINTNINDEEFENSVRMFVLLKGGEQRLITFTEPKEDCTIQEILEQVGVGIDNNTNIGFFEINKDGIDIVVSVGYADEDDDESKPKPKNQRKSCSKPAPVELPVPREPSPAAEPVEEPPKLIPGKMAVCTHCGFLSEDFNKCQRCRRKLPENIKAVLSKSTPLAEQRKGAKKPGIEINLKPRPSAAGASGTGNGTGVAGSTGLSNKSTSAKKRPTRARLQEAEMMVVTLSSDEEDDDSSNDKTSTDGGAADKEPSLESLKSAVPVPAKNATSLACCGISCRTIRIGSYRFVPQFDVALNAKEITLKIPHSQRKGEIIPIVIPRKVVHKVLASFAKTLPVVFIYILPGDAERIAAALGMTPDGEHYYNPVSENQQHRRLVLLPSYFGEEDKWVLQTIYGDPNVFEELTHAEANAILLKTCPQDVAQALTACTAQPATPSEIRQLLIYPPGKGGISINTEDYVCLERDQFLNDVIIDFYLKYMVDQLPEAQRAKVQVFSTFFYTRLTTKPAQNLRKVHPSEVDSTLTAAQKRHARVKNWTKNIDLFEKDFIIVPINENAHWFLAIICFPGMQDAETFSGVKIKREFIKSSSSKRTSLLTQAKPAVSQLIKTIKSPPVAEIDDNSDKDEAEGDDSEFELEDAEESTSSIPDAATRTPKSVEGVPIKQPCILIFDSLAGAGRSRVVATLRDYLTCEYAAKKKQQYVFTKHVICGACPKIPQQNNYTDCGLYLLQYVEHFFKEPIADYRIPIKGLKEWFGEVVVNRKREDISNLIKELMVKYNKDVNVLPAIALPTQNGGPVSENPSGKEDDAGETKTSLKTDALTVGNSSASSLTDTDSQSAVMTTGDESPNSELGFASDGTCNSRQSAMSYLKAKRIVKVKADVSDDTEEEPKKRKMQLCCDPAKDH